MAAKGNGTTRFGQMLSLWRAVQHLSLRDVQEETGIANVTLMRIEHGHVCDVKTWLTLQRWLFQRIGPKPRGRSATP